MAQLVLALLGLWWLGRGHRFFLPKGWLGRASAMVLLVVLLASGLGLYELLGPLSPMTQGVRRIHAEVGRQVPEVAFRYVSDDSKHYLNEFQGKVTLLNLWATWCPPCIPELEVLNELQASFKQQGVVVITLSDESREHILEFTSSRPLGTVSAYAESLEWLESGEARPMTLFIDREGILRELILGARDYQFFEAKVRQYLNAQAGHSATANP